MVIEIFLRVTILKCMTLSKIKAKWVVRIPEENIKVTVKEGSEVKEGDVLAVLKSAVIETFDASYLLSRLSKDNLGRMIDTWQGKKVAEGEVLFAGEGLFSKKVYSPIEGIFNGVDEFGNLLYEIEREEKREILSPVKAKISKIEKEKITMEFRALEIKGEGLGGERTWGDSNFEMITKIGDINSELAGKVILMPELSPAGIIKAEVVGVSGVVTLASDKNQDILEGTGVNLPILALDSTEWKKVEALKDQNCCYRMLLNPRMGRVLLVVE